MTCQMGSFSKASDDVLQQRKMVKTASKHHSGVVDKKSEFAVHIQRLNYSFLQWFQNYTRANKGENIYQCLIEGDYGAKFLVHICGI